MVREASWQRPYGLPVGPRAPRGVRTAVDRIQHVWAVLDPDELRPWTAG
ncbi:hypothetical protein ACFYMI_15625 [Streptomyces collinus]